MAERSGRLYFGVSDTPKGNLIKEVVIRNPGDLTDNDELDLQVGDELIVKFNNGNNEEVYPQLKLMVNDLAQDVGPTGAIPTVTYPGYNEWSAQQLVGFVYCCGKIAGDVITDVDAEFDQAQTATASFTSEETFLNEVQSTPGTYQFTYHVAEDEEATDAWYLNEQVVDLTKYGISCENPVDEDTIIVNVAYVEEHTEDETYYWKAFQIDKATADTYGVTKVFDQLNQLIEGTEDTPIGWGLINDMLEDRLDDFELNYTGQHHPDDWGTVTLEYPDSLYPSEGHETPNKIVDSFKIPAIINSTGDLNNNGDGSLGSKYWNNNENNVFNSASLGIGYHFTNHDNNDEIIRAYIPYALYNNDAINYIGRDALRLYQDNTRDADDRAFVGEPKLRTYGERIRLGLDLSYSGTYQGTTYNHTASKNTRVEIGGAYLPANAWELWYTFGSDAATFYKPVNINSGINIGGTALNTYINNLINQKVPLPILKMGYMQSQVLEYNYGTNSSTVKSRKSAKSGEFRIYFKDDDKTSGNLNMIVPEISGYTPIAVKGWNVNQVTSGSADDFYVWECYLYRSNGESRIHFGLKNTSTTNLKVRFQVYIIYCLNNWYQSLNNLADL